MDRAVARGPAAKPLNVPAHVGVDEKTAGKGQDYITVVSDLDADTVDYIADERRQASLDGYFEKFTAEQRAGIEAVAMDMWEPFAASVRAHLSDANKGNIHTQLGLIAQALQLSSRVCGSKWQLAVGYPERHGHGSASAGSTPGL